MADDGSTRGGRTPKPKADPASADRVDPARARDSDSPAQDAGPNTTSRLRHEIDTGQTGDKVPFEDPAAAPLGTDDEAAGTPNSARQVEAARAEEVTRANQAAAGAATGSGGPEPGAVPLASTRMGMMGEAEVRRGHDDSTYSAPSSDSTAERPRTVADLQGQPSKPGTSIWAVAAVVAIALVIALLLVF